MIYYYDTCIFLHGSNADSGSHEHCVRILNFMNIDWTVAFSRDITLSEAPIEELINQFEIGCAMNGVVYATPTLEDAKRSARSKVQEKRQLRQLGFQGADWNHLCAADSVSARALVSDDEDFIDPANKANPGSKRKLSRVKEFIEDRFSIRVLLSHSCPVGA